MPNPFIPRKGRRSPRVDASAAEPTPASVPPDQSAPPATSPATPNPDHAWKALSLVNEWIRHSDAKAGVTLAFTGVLATMLFNLAKDFTERWWLPDATVIVACVLLVLAGGFCAWTLTPRIRDTDVSSDAINRLFYVSITKHFKGERSRYIDVLHTLTADSDDLTRDLAHQVHANAAIATTKAESVKWAIRSAVAAGGAIALLAVIIGIANSQGS